MMETQILRSCKENDASFPRIGTVCSMEIRELVQIHDDRKNNQQSFEHDVGSNQGKSQGFETRETKNQGNKIFA